MMRNIGFQLRAVPRFLFEPSFETFQRMTEFQGIRRPISLDWLFMFFLSEQNSIRNCQACYQPSCD